MKSLRCLLGLHSWVPLGNSLTLMDSVRQCRRCKIGHHEVMGAGGFRYTPAAMREAWDTRKINNPGAHVEIYGRPFTPTPGGRDE